MERLRGELSNEKVAAFESRTSKYTGDEEHFALLDRLRDRIGSIFNTGNWINPADPVLLDRNLIVDAWAKRAFQAILDALRQPEENVEARHAEASAHLRGTLWFAIDYARQHATGRWPPISYVQSFDDYSDELITVMATRASAR
jgi:hypothetical protein